MLVTVWQNSQTTESWHQWHVTKCVKTAKQHKYTLALVTHTHKTFTLTLMLIFKLDSETDTMFSSGVLPFCMSEVWLGPFIGACTIEPAGEGCKRLDMAWKGKGNEKWLEKLCNTRRRPVSLHYSEIWHRLGPMRRIANFNDTLFRSWVDDFRMCDTKVSDEKHCCTIWSTWSKPWWC